MVRRLWHGYCHNSRYLYEWSENMSMSKQLSIDIGAKDIKIVLGKYNKRKVKLEKACIVNTPDGSYDDGQLLEPDRLKEAIQQGLQGHKMKAKKAIFTIETTLAIIREIVIPQVKKDELSTMIQYEIEQFLIIDFDEYDIQYKIIEEVLERDTKKYRLLIVALPKTIVTSYLTLMKALKLTPMALDIHPNAIAKYSTTQQEYYSLDETIAVIDIGYKTTNVNIIQNGHYGFNRMIKRGGEDILDAIAANYDITIQEATQQLKTHGNLETHENVLVHGTILNELLVEQVNAIITEMNKIFRFYNSRRPGNSIHKIFLHGGMAHIQHLGEYITNNMQIPVKAMDSTIHIARHKNIKDYDLDRYYNCIGALIRK